MNAISDLQESALAEIEACADLQQLDELRVRYLGKKGEITAQLKSLGQMEPEQRRSFGQAVNAARDALNQATGFLNAPGIVQRLFDFCQQRNDRIEQEQEAE